MVYRLGQVVLVTLMLTGAACSKNEPVPQFVVGEDTRVGTDDSAGSDVTVDQVAMDNVTPTDSIPNPDVWEDQWITPEIVDSLCSPDCQGKQCGPNGCGGQCGECAPGSNCQSGLCQTLVGCTPGARECSETVAIECDSTGSGWLTVQDCADSGKGCQFGYCTGCLPQCAGKSCGQDGCGGSCGECPEGSFCGQGICMMGCDSAQCALGKVCFTQNGLPGMCGGTLTFDTNMLGNPISDDVNIEGEYLKAGIQFYSDIPQAVVMTNYYNLASDSQGNSCATRIGEEYWTHPILVRFLVPGTEGYMQGAVKHVSMYIGKSWPSGIVVAGYAPDVDPMDDNAEPVALEFTQQDNTSFVEVNSVVPMGHLYIGPYEDPNFTIDDFEFGPIQLVQ